MGNTGGTTPYPLTPVAILIVSRLAFIIYFSLIFLPPIFGHTIPYLERIPVIWGGYLVGIYLVCEKIFAAFLRRGIDLAFAFPLLLAVFMLNAVSVVSNSQMELPLINRAEHLATFVLLAYIVWVFFQKYLPQQVWKEHAYYTSILVLAITSLVGVGNEIIELVLDTIFHTSTVGLHLDTSLDLLMNTLGAGLFLAVQLILREGNIKIFR